MSYYGQTLRLLNRTEEAIACEEVVNRLKDEFDRRSQNEEVSERIDISRK